MVLYYGLKLPIEILMDFPNSATNFIRRNKESETTEGIVVGP